MSEEPAAEKSMFGQPQVDLLLPEKKPVDQERIERAVREILLAVGEDPDRDGLIDTPSRVARMYAEQFAGLRQEPEDVLTTVFDAEHDEIVLYLPGPQARDAAVRRLTESGLEPVTPAQYWIDNDSVAFSDPDGRMVIFAPWIFGQEAPPARLKGLRWGT